MTEEVDEDWKQEALRMVKEDPELTNAEIAEKLNKPVKTVKNALAKLRKKEKAETSCNQDKEKCSQGYPRKNGDGSSEAPYKIVPIEGKGHGLVATRALHRGELILQEQPVLTAPATFFPGLAVKGLQAPHVFSVTVAMQLQVIKDSLFASFVLYGVKAAILLIPSRS